ncbi:MAG TPA: SRPBCC family protein [Stellaceae bacterium]|nr:SRPBCC family protein [Stellaceae bacterium]
MSGIITPAPIRKSIRVDVAPARAFEIFTTGMARWWLKTHTINPTKSPIKEIALEPRAGGRWFERGEDGSECNWGKVLAWEPPTRLLLAWQINGRWQFDPALITEVDIRFTPDGNGTRVELEHRKLEALGAEAEAMAQAFTGGWGVLLDSFAKQAA